MYQNERHAIESLFSKLSAVEQQAGPRDPDADAFIRSRVSEQPGAPYYMAQTIVVQEQALTAAQARIEELEYRVAGAQARSDNRQGGGFLASLFGSGTPRQPSAPPAQGGRPSPWGQPPASGLAGAGQAGMGAMPSRGGGFLAGAAQTAMGVAGGVLLGNAIGSMFADTPAAETAANAAPASEPAAAEASSTEDDNMDLGGFDEFEI